MTEIKGRAMITRVIQRNLLMQKFTVVTIILFLGACARQPADLSFNNQGHVVNPNNTEPVAKLKLSYDINEAGLSPKGQVNVLAEKLVNELVVHNDALRADQPLLVTTPVMLNGFDKTNDLGLQLQQGMIAAFHAHEFNLVDMNVAESLRSTQQGEFILSRDWQQLPSDLPVSHVVVSSMSFTPEGLVVNARVVDVSNNRVVSAAQSFASNVTLSGYLVPSNKIISRDGVLYRHETEGKESLGVRK
jgi:TolB-like protein